MLHQVLQLERWMSQFLPLPLHANGLIACAVKELLCDNILSLDSQGFALISSCRQRSQLPLVYLLLWWQLDQRSRGMACMLQAQGCTCWTPLVVQKKGRGNSFLVSVVSCDAGGCASSIVHQVQPWRSEPPPCAASLLHQVYLRSQLIV